MSVRCDLTVDDVMFLLKRNWFLDREDIFAMLWELPEDVYYYVFERRHEVPELSDMFHDPPPNKSVLKITDITEKEWNNLIIEKEERRVRAVYKFKKQYVAPPRPRESIDDRMVVLKSDLENKKVILEDMLRTTKKTKKYVPPGQRVVEAEEPMIRDQRNAIQKLENEISFLNERVLTLDKTWSELKCLDAMLQNAGKLYEI